VNVLEPIGGGALRGLAYIGGLTMQGWAGLRATPRVLPLVGKPGHWRAALHQMAAVGVDALPMVGIMSMCAGFTLAMQAGAELRRFGALQYVMDTVAIGFTRELGPLLHGLPCHPRTFPGGNVGEHHVCTVLRGSTQRRLDLETSRSSNRRS
jgi:ABC-type transporter Mla maintaining outer membrane lipid asymmetry permease subunit MlaE